MKTRAQFLERKEYLADKTALVEKRRIQRDYPPHSHEFFEIEFVLDGSARVVINGKEQEISAGDIYFLAPEDIHAVRGAENFIIYNIMFTEEYLPDEISFEQLLLCCSKILHLNEDDNKAVNEIFERLIIEQNTNGAYGKLYVLSLLKCLFIILSRIEKIVDSASTNKNMQSVFLFISRCFKDNITLEDVAEYAHLNPSYFCSYFKKNAGIGFNEYLNNLRIQYAARLIQTTTADITEICYQSGFQSFSTFSRKFKKYYSVSPMQYKKDRGMI